jgi:hypothetical protein
MRRRVLAVALALSWLILAGIDLLEDLDGYSQIALKTYSQSGSLANDIIESADAACVQHASLVGQAIFQWVVPLFTSFSRTSKLHKLHHVYQI